MKTTWSRYRCALLLCICALLTITPLSAQTTSNTANSDTETEKVKKSESASDSAAPVLLSEFRVTASSDTGYGVKDSVSGIRFRTDILTLPKTINVATQEFMKDVGALSLGETVAAMGGQVDTVTGAHVTDLNMRLRGVTANFIYRNGNRGFAPVDPISLDRIEIIKGPSSFFGGQVQAGGFINYVTKQATGKEYTTFQQLAGSFDMYRTEIEKSGSIALGHDKKLLYRVSFAYQTNNSFIEFEAQKKWSPHIALKYDLTDKTILMVDYQYLRREMDFAYHNNLLQVLGPESGNYAFIQNLRPSFNPYGDIAFLNIGSALTEVSIDHKFADWLTLRIAGFQSRTFHTRFNPNVSTLVTVDPLTGARTIGRSGTTFLNQSNNDRTARADLLGNWTFGRAKVKAYAAWERVYGKFIVSNYTSGGSDRLDIDNPNYYSVGTPANATIGTPFKFYGIYDAYSAGTHVELFENLNIFGGGRNDKGYSTKLFGAAIDPKSQFDIITPYYGISYRIAPTISVFASKSESFVPNQGFKFGGELLNPLTGHGTDIGIKFSDFLGGKISGQISVFNLKITDALLADLAHPGFYLTSGSTDEMQGFEFDLGLRPVPEWRVSVSYTNLDGKSVTTGMRPANTPTHSFNLLSNYQFSSGPLKGFGVIGIVSHASNRRYTAGAVPDRPQNQIPGYTKYDLVLSYETTLAGFATQYRVAVRNLGDELYIAGYSGYGPPRTYETSVRVSF